jgi:hypothetical protein
VPSSAPSQSPSNLASPAPSLRTVRNTIRISFGDVRGCRQDRRHDPSPVAFLGTVTVAVGISFWPSAICISVGTPSGISFSSTVRLRRQDRRLIAVGLASSAPSRSPSISFCTITVSVGTPSGSPASGESGCRRDRRLLARLSRGTTPAPVTVAVGISFAVAPSASPSGYHRDLLQWYPPRVAVRIAVC